MSYIIYKNNAFPIDSALVLNREEYNAGAGQHINPRFLIELFSNSGEGVFTYRKSINKVESYPKKPRSICYQNGFYDSEDGRLTIDHQNEVLEKKLNTKEFINSLISIESPRSILEKYDVHRIVSCALGRSTQYQNLCKYFTHEIKGLHYDAKIIELSLRASFSLGAVSQSKNYKYRRAHFIRPAGDNEFISSDNSAIYIPIGITTLKLSIYMPITPSCAVVLEQSDGEDYIGHNGYYSAPYDLVEFLNRCVAINAHDHIFSRKIEEIEKISQWIKHR